MWLHVHKYTFMKGEYFVDCRYQILVFPISLLAAKLTIDIFIHVNNQMHMFLILSPDG